jgi:hypothetical protein
MRSGIQTREWKRYAHLARTCRQSVRMRNLRSHWAALEPIRESSLIMATADGFALPGAQNESIFSQEIIAEAAAADSNLLGEQN